VVVRIVVEATDVDLVAEKKVYMKIISYIYRYITRFTRREKDGKNLQVYSRRYYYYKE
jgi:hypothetical protein